MIARAKPSAPKRKSPASRRKRAGNTKGGIPGSREGTLPDSSPLSDADGQTTGKSSESGATGATGKTAEWVIDGRKLSLSRLDKPLYPKAGFTKADVIQYYMEVGPCLLPHLKDRPLTLKRYPEGVDGFFFYEKRCPSFRPSWVKTAAIWSEGKGEHIHFCVANDLASLVWAANLADLELHTSLARYQKPDQPTAMVFDLDPGEGSDVLGCAKVAVWIRDLLEGSLGLRSWAKTSGSKGLQLYVPLNTPVQFPETKALARAIAERMTADHPSEVLYRMEKKLRAGKVFIDWSQNDAHKTTVCVYSLRARQEPTVSTPLDWKEVEASQTSRSPDALRFLPAQVLKRTREAGDLFEPVLSLKQKLPRDAVTRISKP